MEKTLKIPNHVAIIVDGNGRWAKEKGLPRSKGHEAGFSNLKTIIPYIFDKKVKYVSTYLFSTENFSRSEKEVTFLMNLLVRKVKEVYEMCKKNNIKVVVSGRKDHLNITKKVNLALEDLVTKTKNYTKGVLNICFNYGGHAEIVDATKKIVKDVQNGNLNIENLTEKNYSKYLYNDLPLVDLMIRTSGEMRISNFLPWQCSYAEFYFPKTYFPDFKEQDFDKALEEYTKRDRRFGGVKDDKESN